MSFWSKLSKRSQSNLYFALVFLNRDRRNAFRDVYRFVRAADDVADAPGDPEVALMRLGAWRRELDAIYNGTAHHPYAWRLARAVARYRLSRRHFETLLDGLERDVRRPISPDRDALIAYCEAVTVPLAHLCLEILEIDGPAVMRYARDVGVALQLANILRDVREDAEAGRVYLPARDLAAAGTSPEEILAGRMTSGAREVCRDLAAVARQRIAGARAGLSSAERRRLIVPEIWADVYLALLDKLDAVGFDVMSHRPYLHRRHKLALALRRWTEMRYRAISRRQPVPERP